MASVDTGGFWIFVFKTAADDFKWNHVVRIGSTSDEATAVKMFHIGTNPDAEIVAYEPMESHERLMDVTAEIIKQGGPEYRSLKGNEEKLTKAAVAKLRGKALADPPKAMMTISEMMSRAHAMALTDPAPQ